jgi:uncharacterized protein YyaL (SSP411 family)
VPGYAEDYACLIFGVLELFQATGSSEWLEWALTLQRRQDALFWDDAGGGWFSTTGSDASVRLRLKEDYDGAEPAASSISALNLLTLTHLTGDATWTARLEATFRMFAPRVAASGRTVPMCLAALSMFHAGVVEVVIAGRAGEAGFEDLRRTFNGAYVPASVLVLLDESSRPSSEALLPWTAAMTAADDGARAYVCRDFACQLPARTPAELQARLSSLRGVPR